MHRRRIAVLAVVFACAGAWAAPQTAPDAPVVHAPKAPVPLSDYFKIRRAAVASFSFDESLISYFSDEGGRVDVWVRPVTGGPPRQITHVKGFIEAFVFSPVRDVAVLEADVGGDELMQLYFTDSTGREPAAVFPDDPRTSRADFIRWADDGKTFLYTSSRRDPNYQDLYEYELAGGKSTLLWQASGKLGFSLASRDHQRFVITETISDADTNLYSLRRGEKAPTLLTPHKTDTSYNPLDVSPDGRTLYYTSDESGEFTGLYKMDLATKKSSPVLAPNWDVDSAGFSKSGRYFFTQVNADGSPQVALTDTKTKKAVALPATGGLGALVPGVFSKSDRWLAATLKTDVAPTAIWLIDLEHGGAQRVFDVLPPSFAGHAFTASKSVRIKSFDGREVPAFLFVPKGAGPFPALLQIHGGPTSQSMREFGVFTQYLVSKGYVVLVPNVRGSTGYGKTYTKLDNKDLGGGPLKDVLACKAWLVANARVDAARVAIFGGSYGGYMALAAAAFVPTEFAAHVDVFGPSDLKSLVESFPAYWASGATYIHQKFGDPNDPKDAPYQHDRSPGNYVDRIVRPLLVVQGTNDARVKKDQSDRIVEGLRKRHAPVDYLVIEGEGHGFSKNENRQLTYEVTDRFLDKYIFGDGEVKVLP